MVSKAFANYPSLLDKTVFITGGGSGIGADMVAAFARQGARVAFVDMNASSAADLLASLRNVRTPPLFMACDVSDITALQQAVATAIAQFGEIDVLVNNVANDERHDLLAVTPEYFDSKVAINMKAHFFAVQAVLPSMLKKGAGAIINVGSTGWQNKTAGYPVYGICKSATNGLTRSLAREFGKHNIRVNTLTPGWVMTQRQLDKWVDAAGELAMDQNQCLPGRMVGEDIANMALFLASEDSRMITAQEFVVDAGWT
ncbi:MAG: SDR family NAD(P)-dependent oxidoreductase [Candidatus Aquirickettsiella gammari]